MGGRLPKGRGAITEVPRLLDSVRGMRSIRRKGFKNRVDQLKALGSNPSRFKSVAPPSSVWVRA